MDVVYAERKMAQRTVAIGTSQRGAEEGWNQ